MWGGYWGESTGAYLLKQGKAMSQMGAGGNVVLKQHFFIFLCGRAFDPERLKATSCKNWYFCDLVAPHLQVRVSSTRRLDR